MDGRSEMDGRAEAGFTLVEVLLASAIMLIGVFGVLSTFPQAFRSVKESGQRSVLTHLVSEKLEELRSLDPAHSSLGAGVHPATAFDSQGRHYYPVPGFPEEFSLRWTVQGGPTDGSGTAEAGLRTVIVEGTFLVRYTVSGTPIEQTGSITLVAPTVLPQ